mgnify:FL=1
MHDFFAHDFVVKMNFSFVGKKNSSVFESKESVVFTKTDIFAWENIRSALADENRARFGGSADINLDSKVLWLGISVVFSCSS